MVTPVHRFQSLNGPSVPFHSCAPGPSGAARPHHQPHPQQQQPQAHQLKIHRPAASQQQQQQQQQQPHHQEHSPIPDFPVDEETADCGIPRFRTTRSNIVTSNNVTNAAAAAATSVGGGGTGVNSASERPALPTETTNNGLSRAGFLDFSEISDTELAGYRLTCGVWITFVLATGFVSVAKFYLANRDVGLDMLIYCGLLFTLLLSGCFYSTLFRRAQNNHRHQEQLESEEQHIVTLASDLTLREESAQYAIQQQLNLRLQQQQINLQLQMQRQQQQQQQQLQQPPPPPPPPPPYHIAILIPPPNSPEEAPPPSYDKAMNEDPSHQTRVFIFSKDEEN